MCVFDEDVKVKGNEEVTEAQLAEHQYLRDKLMAQYQEVLDAVVADEGFEQSELEVEPEELSFRDIQKQKTHFSVIVTATQALVDQIEAAPKDQQAFISNAFIVQQGFGVGQSVAEEIVRESSDKDGQETFEWSLKDNGDIFVRFKQADVGRPRRFSIQQWRLYFYRSLVPFELQFGATTEQSRKHAVDRREFFKLLKTRNNELYREIIKCADAKYFAVTGREKVRLDRQVEVDLWWSYIDEYIMVLSAQKPPVDAMPWAINWFKLREGADYMKQLRVARQLNRLSFEQYTFFTQTTGINLGQDRKFTLVENPRKDPYY